MGESITLVDGHSVGDTITRVHDNTSGTARGVQRQHGLNGDVHGGGVEGLEHDLSHLLRLALGFRGASVKRTGVLQEQHGARCRRCDARSSPYHPSWSQYRAQWGTSGSKYHAWTGPRLRRRHRVVPYQPKFRGSQRHSVDM